MQGNTAFSKGLEYEVMSEGCGKKIFGIPLLNPLVMGFMIFPNLDVQIPRSSTHRKYQNILETLFI